MVRLHVVGRHMVLPVYSVVGWCYQSIVPMVDTWCYQVTVLMADTRCYQSIVLMAGVTSP